MTKKLKDVRRNLLSSRIFFILEAMKNDTNPLVAIIMGSTSDWETMRNASEILTDFGVAHECEVVSAHRTPDLLFEFAKAAESRGLEVIIAGAGGAAHLPGMMRGADGFAGLGRSRPEQGFIGHGFAAFDCADARRNSGRNAGNRRGWREKRGASGSFDSG